MFPDQRYVFSSPMLGTNIILHRPHKKKTKVPYKKSSPKHQGTVSFFEHDAHIEHYEFNIKCFWNVNLPGRSILLPITLKISLK